MLLWVMNLGFAASVSGAAVVVPLRTLLGVGT